MRRALVIVLAATGGLVAVLLVAIAFAVWRVDPNDFVAPIQERIKLATGREATIRGGIDFELALTPKLVVRDFALANAAWGGAPQMVAIKELAIEIALLPLLHNRFEVIRIGIVQPTITLETDAQGHANWDFGRAGAGPATSAPGAASVATFGVNAVVVTDGRFVYRDGKSGTATELAIDSLTVAARDAQAPMSIGFRGRIDRVAVALTGSAGSLDSLLRHRWPYRVSLAGAIGEQKTKLATGLRVDGDAVRLEGLDVAFGPSVVRGTVTAFADGARRRYAFDLTAPVLDLTQAATALGASAGLAASRGSAVGSSAARPSLLFSPAPLPLAALRRIDATGRIQVDRLIVARTREFTAADMRLTLHDGRLDVPVLKAAALGGSFDSRVTLGVPASGPATLALTLDARSLDLGAVLGMLGVHRDVKGGRTSVTADLRARGGSLHDWAASMTGNFAATAGPATIANAKRDPASTFDQVARAANPFGDTDATTELKCAVIRLPLAAGIARIDRSVAVETEKLGIAVSGTLDLRNESIDVTFKPQLREGIPIDLAQIAELVRLRGPLRDPRVTIDATASAATAARIGAALGTGGLSELAAALFGTAAQGGAGPCAVALGVRTAGARPAEAKAPAAVHGPEPLNKALEKLFGR